METKTKRPWQSKTFWASFLAGLIGAYRVMAPKYHWDVGWVDGAVIFLGAVGLWGVRTADSTITATPTPDPAVDNVVPDAGKQP